MTVQTIYMYKEKWVTCADQFFFKACDGHLVVILEGLCLVIKVLAGFIPGHAITFLSQMRSFLDHVVPYT